MSGGGRLLSSKHKGFTLAEVLVTLGIIGVVAAMTMPSLIANHNEKQTVVQLKKVYATLSNAYVSVLNEYGAPADWGLPSRDNNESHDMFMAKFDNYLKYIKNCGTTDNGCYTDKIYDLKGNPYTSDVLTVNSFKAILADGSGFALRVWNENCVKDNDICAFFEVDVNGLKKPNRFGRDIFRFYVTPKTIIPYGSPIWPGNEDMNFDNRCLVGGASCTAWVLINENMDYLHCPEKLGWNKAKSCK